MFVFACGAQYIRVHAASLSVPHRGRGFVAGGGAGTTGGAVTSPGPVGEAAVAGSGRRGWGLAGEEIAQSVKETIPVVVHGTTISTTSIDTRTQPSPLARPRGESIHDEIHRA